MQLKTALRPWPFQAPRFLLLAGALTAALFTGTARAADDALRVEIDQAYLVSLNQPGAEVIVGNPSIADVSVQNARVLVVTGKSVGLTNLIVLDSTGKQIYSEKVSVSADAQQLVTVNKGKDRETYSCSPLCGPVLIPGDSPVHADNLSKVIRNKLGIAQSAAEGTTVQQ